MAQIEALEQDAALRVIMAASSHKKRDRDVDKLMVELHSANEESIALKAIVGDAAAQGAKTRQVQVQELERQLADVHVAHATAKDKRGALNNDIDPGEQPMPACAKQVRANLTCHSHRRITSSSQLRHSAHRPAGEGGAQK